MPAIKLAPEASSFRDLVPPLYGHSRHRPPRFGMRSGDRGPNWIPDGHAHAQQDPQRPLMAVNVQGKCKLTGDFDMQLDYALTTWPVRNGVRLGLAAGTSSVQRNSNPANADNRYVTDFTGPTTVVETQDMTGSLRLSRVGSVITGYYLSKGRWVAIASTNGSTDPLPYGIPPWTDPAIFGKA